MSIQNFTALSPIYQEIAAIVSRYAAAAEDPGATPLIDGLHLGCASHPSKHHTAIWPCMAMVVQGSKSVTLGNEVYEYTPGSYLVVSLDLPVTSKVVRASTDIPYLGVGMAIKGERLAELFSRVHIPRSAMVASDRDRGVAVHPVEPPLLDAMLRMVRLLDHPDDIPAMAPLIEQEILYRLLKGPYGPRLVRIAEADTPSNKIAKAVTWLRDHFDQPLRIDALAVHAGMSVSSLHHHFSAVTAMTPLQYQKRLRLNEARRLLLVERLDVGAAGYRVGYQSPSQFSREYARHYGLPPARDVNQIREPA